MFSILVLCSGAKHTKSEMAEEIYQVLQKSLHHFDVALKHLSNAGICIKAELFVALHGRYYVTTQSGVTASQHARS